MGERSKSTLFLMEQLIVIAVFAVCAAVCVNIIVSSYLMTVEAVNTKNALIISESAAETFKATGGDIRRVAEILSGSVNNYNSYTSYYSYYDDNLFFVYYNINWQPCSREQASFVLHLARTDTEHQLVIFGDIAVHKKEAGDELMRLPIAVRRSGL